MSIIQDIEMNEIVKDYNNGLSPVKLSEKYPKYSPYVIRSNLKKCGVFQNKYIPDNIKELIIDDYKKGVTLVDLSKKYGFSENSIRNKLISVGLYEKRKNMEFTNEEIKILRTYYPSGDWDSLFKYLPNRDKKSIYAKAWSLNINQNDWYWNELKVCQVLESKKFYLKSNFTNIQDKHIIQDEDGYLYYLQLAGLLYEDKNPNKISPDNIYTISNIKHFIEINNLDCELLSESYVNSQDKLEWKCHCGEKYLCSWTDFLAGKHQCNDCSLIESHRKLSHSIDFVKKILKINLTKLLKKHILLFPKNLQLLLMMDIKLSLIATIFIQIEILKFFAKIIHM